MGRNRNTSSWDAHRSRRHAAFNLTNFPPPKPTPVPDDDDNFDWPGSVSSSPDAYLYAVAFRDKHFTFLVGRDNEPQFRMIVERPAPDDEDSTGVHARRYEVGQDPQLVWNLNPLTNLSRSQHKAGLRVTDHVLYAKTPEELGYRWLDDGQARTQWLNRDTQFWDILNFEPPNGAVPDTYTIAAAGRLVAKTEIGGAKLKWKAVKISIVAASGWTGSAPTPIHTNHSWPAKFDGATATEEFYKFGNLASRVTPKTPKPTLGGFVVGYGLYEVLNGKHQGQEYYAVTPPIQGLHPWQVDDPELP